MFTAQLWQCLGLFLILFPTLNVEMSFWHASPKASWELPPQSLQRHRPRQPFTEQKNEQTKKKHFDGGVTNQWCFMVLIGKTEKTTVTNRTMVG